MVEQSTAFNKLAMHGALDMVRDVHAATSLARSAWRKTRRHSREVMPVRQSASELVGAILLRLLL